MEKFDIAVIGGGPGGYVAAIKAAQSGKNVCLFEKDTVGGVCLNRGCIPTKTFLRSAAVLREVKEAGYYAVGGVDASSASVDMEKLQSIKRRHIKKLTGGVRSLLLGNGVKVFSGEATLKSANTIICNGETVTADNVILALGSEPVMPTLETGGSAPRVITSDEALDLTAPPRSIVIIGGGVIGVEFAYFFSSLGVQTAIIEMMPRILPMVDDEIAAMAAADLKKGGVSIQTGAKAERLADGQVYFTKGAEQGAFPAEIVLMAVGRRPNTAGLSELGINVQKGAVVTDAHLRTTLPNVYAIGDMNGKSMLAHTASAEGIVAVEHILGKNRAMSYDAIPSCIYIQPEIAAVGMTEKQAREQRGEVRVGTFPLAANGKAGVEGESRGMIKVIGDGKYGEVLGVHIYGVHAVEMIAETVLAMNLEATAEEIANAVHPHPTVSEIVGEAFHDMLGGAIHFLTNK